MITCLLTLCIPSLKIMGKMGAKASPLPSEPRPSPPRPSESRPAARPAAASTDLMDYEEPAMAAVRVAAKAPPPPKKMSVGLGLFKRSPGRPTDLAAVLAEATYDPDFAAQVVSSLAGAVQDGRFDSFRVNFEVEGGSEAEALAALMASRGVGAAAAAETLAGAVNAMLIPLVDAAAEAASCGAGAGGDAAAMAAVSGLQAFMGHAGLLFEALAAGVAIAPVKYSGKTSKAKLEGLFAKCVRLELREALHCPAIGEQQQRESFARANPRTLVASPQIHGQGAAAGIGHRRRFGG